VMPKRFKAKKEQFIFNFLNTNEEGVSFHELQLIKEEYKRPVAERDYDFLDLMAARLKFFQRFTKPTRVYLLKLAQVVEYPPDSVIFNQVFYSFTSACIPVCIPVYFSVSSEMFSPFFLSLSSFPACLPLSSLPPFLLASFLHSLLTYFIPACAFTLTTFLSLFLPDSLHFNLFPFLSLPASIIPIQL
jgi:hypothetical protein